MIKQILIALVFSVPLSAQIRPIGPVGPAPVVPIRERPISFFADPTTNVYIQTPKGVSAYTSSAGQLSLVSGSPFKTSGQLAGVTGQYLISMGTDYIHTYPLATTGALGSEVSSTDTQSYDGSECGTVNYGQGGVLNNGVFYVQLFDDGVGNCSDWQSYQMSANGTFAFAGNVLGTAYSDGNAVPTSNLTFDSSGQYAYGIAWNEIAWQPGIVPFVTASGSLQNSETFTEVDPAVDTTLDYFLVPEMAAADSSEHLAVLMSGWFYDDNGSSPENPQLASYTIDPATGSIVSANTQDNAPFTTLMSVNSMSISPDGLFVALGGVDGVQVFNFNGAAPATSLDSVLPSETIDAVAWDNQGYLYGLSSASGELHVLQVTAKGAVEISGSPYAVGNTGVVIVFPAN